MHEPRRLLLSRWIYMCVCSLDSIDTNDSLETYMSHTLIYLFFQEIQVNAHVVDTLFMIDQCLSCAIFDLLKTLLHLVTNLRDRQRHNITGTWKAMVRIKRIKCKDSKRTLSFRSRRTEARSSFVGNNARRPARSRTVCSSTLSLSSVCRTRVSVAVWRVETSARWLLIVWMFPSASRWECSMTSRRRLMLIISGLLLCREGETTYLWAYAERWDPY